MRQGAARGVVDLLMTLGLWFLMGYHLWGERAHEWVGAGTLALFLVHHLLNRRWYPGLARGPWTVLRRLSALVNGLLLFRLGQGVHTHHDLLVRDVAVTVKLPRQNRMNGRQVETGTIRQ